LLRQRISIEEAEKILKTRAEEIQRLRDWKTNRARQLFEILADLTIEDGPWLRWGLESLNLWLSELINKTVRRSSPMANIYLTGSHRKNCRALQWEEKGLEG